MLAIKLTPDEFGVVGIAIVVSAFIQSFSELGFGAALIHKKNTANGHFSSVFFVNLLLGIILGGTCFLFADIISAIFNSERIAPILRVLSVGFIVNSVSLSHIAMLQKEMRFRDLARRDVYASIAGAIAGIAALLSGAGVWSIVVQLITYYIVGALIIWHLAAWRPRLSEYSLDFLKELWPYSSKILMTNLLNFGVKNTDRILIGGALGTYALGIYTFGYNLVMLPISSINAAIGTYLFPKYSAMQDKLSEVRFSYLRVMKLTFFSLAPLVIIFSQTVHVFVDLIWGDAWAEAIPTIQVLCALAILGCFVAPSGQLMKSFGRPDWLLYWSIFTILLSAILLFLGIKIAGLIGASLALLLSCVLSLPVVMLIIKQLIGVDFRKIIKLIGPIAIASISMLATFLVSKIQGYDGLLSLSITTFAALAIYLIVMVWFDKSAQNIAKLFCSGERRIVHLVRLFANHPY